MSIWLVLRYVIKKELQSPPFLSENLLYEKQPGRQRYEYRYEIGQGPLVDFLTEKNYLKKAFEPNELTEVDFMDEEIGEHDTKTMYNVAIKIKEALDKNSEAFIKKVGYDSTWRSGNTRDILDAQLREFIIFCEFGLKNNIKEYEHYFQ